MPIYQIFVIDESNTAVRCSEFMADDDIAALKFFSECEQPEPAELWLGARRIDQTSQVECCETYPRAFNALVGLARGRRSSVATGAV